ncbi:MAG: DUF6677 family protein [Planctomycetota bacterium]|jgi:hypothetical protein
MKLSSKNTVLLFMMTVGLVGWIVPGGGYFILKKHKHAVIVFLVITLTFLTGLYVGSIGVIDPVKSKIPYVGQILNSPFVAVMSNKTGSGSYPVSGKPEEIGQIYTSTSGLLNLLCIVNCVYLAHLRKFGQEQK